MIRKRLMTEINLASLNLKDNFQSIFYSEDFQDILIATLEQKYGGSYRSHRAARIIQQAYRQYRLRNKLSSSLYYDTKSVHCRNYSMPDNLHYLNEDDGSHSSNDCLVKSPTKACPTMRNLKSSRIKDSLSLLLPELQGASFGRSSHSESSNTETEIVAQEQSFGGSQYKIGDILSSKCEEDLENFQNCSIKTDSTDESDSGSDKLSTFCPDSNIIVKMPPPMPVISTSILSMKTDKPRTKPPIFSFDKSLAGADYPRTDNEIINMKSSLPPRAAMSSNTTISMSRSPRDSGVSSHSSNTDLLTFECPGQLGESGRGYTTTCLHPQRPQSTTISPGATKGHTPSSIVQKDTYSELDSMVDIGIPPITEDNDSLFESTGHPIPSVMTSSKDSGVDADCGGGGPSSQPGHLRRLSFQDRPMYWKLFHRQSCLTESVDPTPPSRSLSRKVNIDSPTSPSPWMKNSIEEWELEPNIKPQEIECKEMANRVLYRVAVNLFNRNAAVGLKFMEDHHIFNVRCPIEIANFLRSREVNLQVLTDFISSRNSVFNLQVLRCFLQNLSLQNLSFLEAFDTFISSFKLPDDSIKINYLISHFCQYYTLHVQKCTGINLGALMGLSRVIVLLKSSVIRSRSTLSSNSVLSFPDFVKNIQNCFKGQHMPYTMEMLQKIYISITRSSADAGDLAENLINRIGNIDECKYSRSSVVSSKAGKAGGSSGYLQQSHRRLTYCCDVQQADVFGKKLKKNEHQRSVFVFNDTVVVAKRLSKVSSKQSKLFRTDSKFQCKMIINLLNHKVSRTTCPGASYQISISPCGHLVRPMPGTGHSIFLVCDTEHSRDKLLSKMAISQMEGRCVERLRLQQWHCAHDNDHQCSCLSIINPPLPSPVHPRPIGP